MGFSDKELFCGLPLGLRENRLVFGKAVKETVPSIRAFGDLKDVFLEKPKEPALPAYFMYRDVCLEENRKMIEEANLRFDITVIPPAVIGKEFVKTLGHSHPFIDGAKLSYPEVYEVISGMGHFVLQGENECFVVEAKEGEHVLIGPNLAHATINPSNETLVLANWVERNFQSDYSKIKQKHGMAFYQTTQGWIKNMHYPENFSLRFFPAKNVPEFGFEEEKPMYRMVEEISKLDFLKKPHEHEKVFEEYFKA